MSTGLRILVPIKRVIDYAVKLPSKTRLSNHSSNFTNTCT